MPMKQHCIGCRNSASASARACTHFQAYRTISTHHTAVAVSSIVSPMAVGRDQTVLASRQLPPSPVRPSTIPKNAAGTYLLEVMQYPGVATVTTRAPEYDNGLAMRALCSVLRFFVEIRAVLTERARPGGVHSGAQVCIGARMRVRRCFYQFSYNEELSWQ